jgi:hypothetical protein
MARLTAWPVPGTVKSIIWRISTEEIAMPQVPLSKSRLAIFALFTLLAACSAKQGAQDDGVNATAQLTATDLHPATSSPRNLYVLYQGVNTLVEYSHDGSQVLRTITKGIHGPKAIIVDPQGTLYIANSTDPKRGGVNVYLPGKLSPATNIKTDRSPVIALDSNGNLYVAGRRSVSVYANQGKTLLRSIDTMKYVYSVALDSLDNLYVGTGRGINVYEQGATTPSYSIPLPYAFYMAFDGRGELYALAYYKTDEIIEEFAPGSSSPDRQIGDFSRANELTLDKHDNLYVGNCGACFFGDAGSVLVYPRKQTSPSRTIVDGIAQPYALAYDSPDLYVADFDKADVTIYLHGKTTLTNTILPVGNGIPIAFAFGP